MSERDPLRLLTIEAASDVLGIDEREVRTLIELRQIHVYRVGVSQQPRIPRRSLELWQERIAEGKAFSPVQTMQKTVQSRTGRIGAEQGTSGHAQSRKVAS